MPLGLCTYVVRTFMSVPNDLSTYFPENLILGLRPARARHTFCRAGESRPQHPGFAVCTDLYEEAPGERLGDLPTCSTQQVSPMLSHCRSRSQTRTLRLLPWVFFSSFFRKTVRRWKPPKDISGSSGYRFSFPQLKWDLTISRLVGRRVTTPPLLPQGTSSGITTYDILPPVEQLGVECVYPFLAFRSH